MWFILEKTCFTRLIPLEDYVFYIGNTVGISICNPNLHDFIALFPHSIKLNFKFGSSFLGNIKGRYIVSTYPIKLKIVDQFCIHSDKTGNLFC